MVTGGRRRRWRRNNFERKAEREARTHSPDWLLCLGNRGKKEKT